METSIRGAAGEAVIYTDVLDAESTKQLFLMMNCELFQGCTVRIMPDVHAGKGSVIGFTSTLSDKLCPNIVGVDLSCGVTLDKISEKRGIDFDALDKAIRNNVPSGFAIRDDLYRPLRNGNSKLGGLYQEIEKNIIEVSCKVGIDKDRSINSIGSMGSGNHFCELVRSKEGVYYLHIHSGSRGLGAKIAEYHQAKAYKLHDAGVFPKGTPKVLSWLTGADAEEYKKDSILAQKYSSLSRAVMADAISKAMGWGLEEHVESIHNFIDFDAGVLRKGAISSQEGEKVVIPISMAEGVIVAKGLGNPKWNFSAPHGAGRLLARGEAKRQLSMEDFKKSMEGVWSSCVCTGTLDESPQAYKGAEYILERIKDTVEVLEVIKPVYNFKAGSEKP
jgi:RNA-splicing ligase RtcB